VVLTEIIGLKESRSTLPLKLIRTRAWTEKGKGPALMCPGEAVMPRARLRLTSKERKRQVKAPVPLLGENKLVQREPPAMCRRRPEYSLPNPHRKSLKCADVG
jgi:hypothetical protein